LCVGEDFPPSSDNTDEAASERSRPMRARFPAGTHRCRSSEETPRSSRVKSVCLS
jgi:hypothetical protein